MNKLFANTLIQQQQQKITDSSGDHFTKWSTKSEYTYV